MNCTRCAQDLPEGSRFCPSCGAATDVSSAATATVGVGPAGKAAALHSSRVSHPSLDDGRYPPGAVVAERYRIVGLLGRGGMGEVYRADDLKLGQPVALKFLPVGFELDDHRRQRFFNEVRTSLRVTHPNVCRVYDVGEVDGHPYLSMEYVDGEDLASLLRRIGRLPQDKAIEMARQLCMGIHAAHEEGILHRDLKPANVMLDGRGRIKITDFGLAGLQESFEGPEVRAGTPAYMAPEQIEGREVSVRSDIYSLGLVLYEMFTGKRVFEGASVAEIALAHSQTPPTQPTSVVGDLDAAVEAVILRCLEKDPARRPGSAVSIAAALPGGDPLAAALAAGVTPSPELVAEAGETEGLRPAVALGVLGALIALLGLYLFTAGRTQITRLTPLPSSPEVLVKEARDLLQTMGYDEPPVDSSYGFTYIGSSLRALGSIHSPADQAQRLADGWPAIAFWYRESPVPLVPLDRGRIRAEAYDPPRIAPGMLRMWMRADGGLEYFGIVPPAYDDVTDPGPEPDWNPLLEAAGVDLATLEATDPVWTPNVNTSSRRAWKARISPPLDLDVHIEAASFGSRPVLFKVHWPWDEPPGERDLTPPSLLARIKGMINITWLVVVLASGAVLARRNVRLGRGDRKGAVRLGIAVCICRVLSWVIGGHHVASEAEVSLTLSNLASGLLGGGIVAMLYLALEPYFRRIWPQWLVSWVRLLDGRLRDPLVGRHLLAGTIYGIVHSLIFDLYHLAPRWLGLPQPYLTGLTDTGSEAIALTGMRQALSQIIGIPGAAVSFALIGVTMLLVLRIILRRNLPAYVGWLILGMLVFNPGTGPVWYDLSTVAIATGVGLAMLVRFGLLTLMTGVTVARVIESATVTTDLSVWYSPGVVLSLLAVAVLVAWSFRTALGGRSLFRESVLEG